MTKSKVKAKALSAMGHHNAVLLVPTYSGADLRGNSTICIHSVRSQSTKSVIRYANLAFFRRVVLQLNLMLVLRLY